MWSFMSGLLGGGTQEEGAERAKAIGEGDTEAAGAQEDPELRQGRGKFGNLAMKAVMSYVGGGYGGEGTAAAEGAAGGGAASGALELGQAGSTVPSTLPANTMPTTGASGLYEMNDSVMPVNAPDAPTPPVRAERSWADYVAEAAKGYGKNKIKQKVGKYADFASAFGGKDAGSGLYNWG